MLTKIGLNSTAIKEFGVDLTAIRTYGKFGLVAFVSPFLATFIMQSWLNYAVFPFLKEDSESYWYECPPVCNNLGLTIDRWIDLGRTPLFLIVLCGIIALVAGLKARSGWTLTAGGWAFFATLWLWCSYSLTTSY